MSSCKHTCYAKYIQLLLVFWHFWNPTSAQIYEIVSLLYVFVRYFFRVKLGTLAAMRWAYVFEPHWLSCEVVCSLSKLALASTQWWNISCWHLPMFTLSCAVWGQIGRAFTQQSQYVSYSLNISCVGRGHDRSCYSLNISCVGRGQDWSCCSLNISCVEEDMIGLAVASISAV